MTVTSTETASPAKSPKQAKNLKRKKGGDAEAAVATPQKSPQKKMKQQKNVDSPKVKDDKKAGLTVNGTPDTTNGSPKKKKKSIKFNESVNVREIPAVGKENSHPADGKKKKKDKGQKKQKLKEKIADKADKIKNKLKKGGKKTEAVEKLSKKEDRERQKSKKELRKKRKTEGVYDIGVQAKKVWEEVRREDCPEEKKIKLITELHELVKGNIKKIIFAHDTVRVVECLMALGTTEIRSALFQELKDDILEMAKSKYAHFFVEKMLRYGTKEQKEQIYKVMEGNIAKLMKNKTAGFVVEQFYNDCANASQRNSMLQEFLGPEYRLFKEPEIRSVSEILEKHPEKKDDIVKHLFSNLEVLIRKGCYNHSLVHAVLHNFLAVADPKQRSEIIEQMRESLVHIIHSRHGAMAGLYSVWHGTAKDRKAIIKSLKTFVTKIATDEHGHLVLLGIFDQVDDTKFVGKAIIGEIAENFDEIISNKFGMRVVKYLMAGRDSTYIYVDTIKLLEKGDGNEHSKKEREVRCKELREIGAPPALLWVSKNIPNGLYDPPTTITFTSIINYAPESDLLKQVFTLLAEEAAKPFYKGDSEPNIIEDPACHMMLKKLIKQDVERDAAGRTTFVSVLLAGVDDEGIEAWISCNRGAFLMVACWESNIKSVQQTVREKLKPLTKTLKKQKSKGAELLLRKLS